MNCSRTFLHSNSLYNNIFIEEYYPLLLPLLSFPLFLIFPPLAHCDFILRTVNIDQNLVFCLEYQNFYLRQLGQLHLLTALEIIFVVQLAF